MVKATVADTLTGRGVKTKQATILGRAVIYHVRRSARANRSFVRVGPLGTEVVLGKRTPEKRAPELVQHFASWIVQRLEQLEKNGQLLTARPGADGELPDAIFLHGQTVRLTWDSAPPILSSMRRRRTAPCAELIEGVLHIPISKNDIKAEELLARFLRDEAKRELQACVTRRAAEMGVAPIRVGLRAQRTLWGSASRRGSLSFNWLVVIAPPAVLDYLVVHELAHMREMNHSARFWAVVAEYCVEWPTYRNWLHTNGWRLIAPFAQQIRPPL